VGTVAEVLHAVGRSCPPLADVVRADGSLAPYYLVSVDGHGFVTDLNRRLRPEERLVLLSADAGG
jgi:hypothetical protein